MVDENRLEFLMRKLHISREEALELEGYDEDVDKNRPTPYDLTPEQKKVVQDMNRHCVHKKSGPRTVERKPNEIKEGIIEELADYIENEMELLIKDNVVSPFEVEITNKNRMIHFRVADKEYDLQLIEKRAPKKK